MRRFISGLAGFARVCRSDLSNMRQQERTLARDYRSLQTSVKKTLVWSKPKLSTKELIAPMALRAKTQVSEEKPCRSNEPISEGVDLSTRQRTNSMSVLAHPMPFPVRHYGMRAQPCKAAERIYRSKAREALREERIDMIDEYLNWHTPEIAEQLDGSVDPVLHVGNFESNELKWKGETAPKAL